MAEPEHVAELVAAMRGATNKPVTVKHRIGIDDQDTYEHMLRFVDIVAAAGAQRFTVHARKAWLQGLSPKENRTVPPLRHAEVARLARERPHLTIETNGGITTLDEAQRHLACVSSVMIGRAAYEAPMRFAEADTRFFASSEPIPTLRQVVSSMHEVVEDELQRGTRLATVIKPMIPLARGVPGARAWRRFLTEGVHGTQDGHQLLRRAIETLPADALDVPQAVLQPSSVATPSVPAGVGSREPVTT